MFKTSPMAVTSSGRGSICLFRFVRCCLAVAATTASWHESDPQEIGDGFKELKEYLCVLPLDNNNAVFNLCCRLCSAYERKAFIDGLKYGAELMLELGKEAAR